MFSRELLFVAPVLVERWQLIVGTKFSRGKRGEVGGLTCRSRTSAIYISIMNRKEKASRFYWRRRPGGQATPGRLQSCRSCQSATAQSFSTAAAPVTAAS